MGKTRLYSEDCFSKCKNKSLMFADLSKERSLELSIEHSVDDRID